MCLLGVFNILTRFMCVENSQHLYAGRCAEWEGRAELC